MRGGAGVSLYSEFDNWTASVGEETATFIGEN